MTRNTKVLSDFVAYCAAHPEERFWQALRNWAEVDRVVVFKDYPDLGGGVDTFYWEEKFQAQPYGD